MSTFPIIAYLGGTWPDGDPETAPFTPAQGLTITLYVGTDGTVQLLVRNADGSVKDISGFEIVLFTTFLTDGRLATLTDPTDGICELDFAQHDTLTPPVTPKRYRYQIIATDTGTREALTIVGDFVVAASLGSPETPVNSYTPSEIVAYGLPAPVLGGTLQVTGVSPTTLAWATGSGTGTVTSVALTAPSFLSVAGSPVTTAGTLALTLATQASNLVFAGPATGADAAPTFRALVTADLPAGVVTSVTASTPIVSSGGATPNITHAASGVSAATYGSASTVPVVAINATGHVTGATDTAIAISASAVTSGTLAEARGGTGNSSYAVGDLLYAAASTTLGKLADVAAGSYLRSGGVTTAPLWSTLTLPNAATTGDVLVATGTNAVGVVAAVSPGGYMLGSNGTGTAPSYQQPGVVADSISTASGTTINVNVDTTIYTVPTAPTNKGTFVCTGIAGRVTQQLVAGSGAPNYNVTVGLTAGGTDFLTSQNVVAATAVGTRFGLTLSTLGASCIAADGYNAYLSATNTIIVRLAIANTGTISTAGIIRWTVTGYWI